MELREKGLGSDQTDEIQPNGGNGSTYTPAPEKIPIKIRHFVRGPSATS